METSSLSKVRGSMGLTDVFSAILSPLSILGESFEVYKYGRVLTKEERAELRLAQLKQENQRLEAEILAEANVELTRKLGTMRNSEKNGESSPAEEAVEQEVLELKGCTLFFKGEYTSLEPRLASLLELLWDGQYHSLGQLIEGMTGHNIEAKDLKNDLKNWVYGLNCSLKEALGQPLHGKRWVIRTVEKGTPGYQFKKPD